MTPTAALTQRQQQIVDFVRECQRQGQTPTLRQIAQRFGLASLNGVSQHLRLIERKGAIKRVAGKWRSICVLAGGAP